MCVGPKGILADVLSCPRALDRQLGVVWEESESPRRSRISPLGFAKLYCIAHSLTRRAALGVNVQVMTAASGLRSGRAESCLPAISSRELGLSAWKWWSTRFSPLHANQKRRGKKEQGTKGSKQTGRKTGRFLLLWLPPLRVLVLLLRTLTRLVTRETNGPEKKRPSPSFFSFLLLSVSLSTRSVLPRLRLDGGVCLSERANCQSSSPLEKEETKKGGVTHRTGSG